MTEPLDFNPSTVARLLAAYDGFGLRRAGSTGDHACARWQRTLAGADHTTLQPVDLPVISVREAFLEWPGGRIDGLPAFDAPDTGPGDATGTMVLADLQGASGPGDSRRPGKAVGHPATIGSLAVDPGAASIKGQPLERMRKASGHQALVIATLGAGGSLAPVNAQYHVSPFGPPVLQVAGSEVEALERLASAGAIVRVRIATDRTIGQSVNLEARPWKGRPRRVLLTPRTSWWESTAERAGGILAWMAGIRAAAVAGTAVCGFSSCAHELGHIGLEKILRDAGDLLAPDVQWLHLGANLGCSTDPRMTLRASVSDDAIRMHALLTLAGVPDALIEVEPIARAMGEARDLDLHGARVVSLIGRNGHFHAPSDRWPGNVSATLVAAIAQATAAWATAAA